MSVARITVIPLILVLGLAAGVVAQDQLSGAAAIEARHELMESNAATMAAAKDATGADAIAAGETLVANFTRLPDLIPEDSQEGETRALPAIWEDTAGFLAEVTAAREAAQGVLDAANAGDAQAYAQALEAMGERCGSCHSKFRAPQG